MPFSAKFSMTLQTEILSTETSDFSQTNNFSQVIYFRVRDRQDALYTVQMVGLLVVLGLTVL